MRTCKLIVAAFAVVLFTTSVRAGHFCHHCGCQRNCRKVCRLECGKKTEEKIEYEVECEDFCVPGRSRKCGVKIECDSSGHHHRKIIWQPTCAKVYTRKTLVKKAVSKEVPDYKWVVEEYCCVCGHCIKVDDKAKEGRAGSQSARPPVAMNADESVEEVSDEMPADHHKVGFVQVVAADGEPSPDHTDGELLFSDDEDATRPIKDSRWPLFRLFMR
jgi:hypothetical protein